MTTKTSSEMPRTLGLASIIGLGVGGVVGAGVFVLTGTAAATYAGPAIVLSFVLAGVACLLTALCYAEFAGMLPLAGGAYSYVRATFGDRAGWFVGWSLILEYLVVCSLISVGWSSYFTSSLHFFGAEMPTAITKGPIELVGGQFRATGSIANLPALFIVLFNAAILVTGMRQSARFNATIVTIKLSFIALFVGFGFAHVNSANWHPFVPPNLGQWGQFGWSGVLRGAAIVFVAFLGFDALATMSQEARDPQRTVPLAMIGTLIALLTIYIAVSLTMTGLAPYQSLGVPHAFNVAIAAGGPSLAWLQPLASIATVFGLSSGIMMVLIAQSRTFMRMADDKLFPPIFAEVDPVRGNPVKGTLIVAFAAATLAAFLPIELLSGLVAIGTLMAFAAVSLGVIVARRLHPDWPRPFRVPLVPLLPLSAFVWCCVLLAFLPAATWEIFIAWTLIGAACFLAIRHRRT